MAMFDYPEEHLPQKYKNWYWKRLLRITISFFVLWTVIAVWWHLPAPYAWREILVFGNMPLHWYLAAFISIWVGVIMIFVYHAIMSRVDEEFRRQTATLKVWKELSKDVSLQPAGAAAASAAAQSPPQSS